MSGLLCKDISLICTRKQNLILFGAILLFMGYSVDLMFLVGYGTMLFGLLAVSTLSYDEFDNGMPFLMTLPITARDYVKEKYLFMGLGVALGWLVSLVVGLVMSMVKGENINLSESSIEIISMLVVFLGIAGIMLIVELKFGVEKSRTVMMFLGGIGFACGIIGSKFLPEEAGEAANMATNVSDMQIFIALLVISAAVFFASYYGSCKIMEKKQC